MSPQKGNLSFIFSITDKDAIGLQLSILEALISIGGIALAIGGLFGYAVIKNQAISRAEEVADNRFKEYIIELERKRNNAGQPARENFDTSASQELEGD